MNKLIKDGNVAVIYNNSYGSGWYTCNTNFPQCIFEPELVEIVFKLVHIRNQIINSGPRVMKRDIQLKEESAPHLKQLQDICFKLYGENFYVSQHQSLNIEWIVEGNEFYFDEYDGKEIIRYGACANKQSFIA